MSAVQRVALSNGRRERQAESGLLPTFAFRDESGHETRVSIGWIILAYNLFGACYMFGADGGEALLYLAGGILAVLALAPIWMRRPRYLLIGFALYLVLEDALLGPYWKHLVFAKSAPDVLIFAVLAWRGLRHLKHRRVFLSGIELPLAAILLVAAASTVINHTPFGTAGQGVYTLLRYAAVFMLAAQSRFTMGDLRGLIRIITFFAMAESAIGLLQYVLLRTIDFQLFGYYFVQGTSSYFNILGAFLAIACVLALATYTTDVVPRPRIELCVLLGLCALTITLALSRQSLGMLAIGWVVAALLGRRKTPLIQLWLPLASTVVGVALGLAMIWLGSRSYLQQRNAQASMSHAHGATVNTSISGTHLDGALPAPMLLSHITARAAPIAMPVATPIATPATPTATRTPTATASPGASGASNGSGSTGASGGTKQTKSSRVYNSTLNGKLKQFGANLFSTDFYVNARMYEIANGGEAILHRSPLLGLGPGTFGGQSTFHDVAFYQRLHVGLLLSDPNHNYVADVEWMNVFGQLGLLGLLAFLWMFAALLRIALRIYRAQPADSILARSALACVALVPMFLFAGFTGPNFEVRMIAIWLWLFGGVVVAVARQGRFIQTDQPLLPQIRVKRTLEPGAPSATRATTGEPDAPRPATWERIMPPRWNPNGPSGRPPVRSFWDETETPPGQ